MAYTKTTWVDGTTAITATELNRIETGVEDAHAGDLDLLSVGTGVLADNAVTNVKIASGVDAAKLTTGTLPIARIADGAVTSAKLRNSAALSVIGRSANTAGVPADMAAGTDGHVLRRAGTGLAFGTVATAGLAAAAVTAAKLATGADERDWVGGRIAVLAAGAIGSLAFASLWTGDVHFGATASGGNLVPAAANGNASGNNALTGTWRCLGRGITDSPTLWLRIS